MSEMDPHKRRKMNIEHVFECGHDQGHGVKGQASTSTGFTLD